MIRSATVLFGVVTYFGKLGFSIDGKNDRVQIEDEGGPGFGQGKQPGSDLIVEGDELANSFWGKPFEESPKSGLVGKPRETQQSKEDAVVLKDFGLVDSAQSCHDGIEESENEIGGKIAGIALRDFDIFLNLPSQLDLAAKTLQKDHAPEMG
jgi:hypothetical protein